MDLRLVPAAGYVPALGEIAVTVGCVALLVLAYRAVVIHFPVISLPTRTAGPREKYTVRG